MDVLVTILLAVQMISALVMIGLILLQHGKGADMGAAFGGGNSGSLFGASGSANFLSRSTGVLAGVFFVCTLALAYFSGVRPTSSGGTSVLEKAGAAVTAPAAGASAAAGGAQAIPGNTKAGEAMPAIPAAVTTIPPANSATRSVEPTANPAPAPIPAK